MEPGQILTQFGPWGLAVILALAGAKWVAVRLEKSETKASDLAAQALRRCDEERVAMTAKIEKLEDRISDLYEDTIRKSTEAINRFCDSMDRKP